MTQLIRSRKGGMVEAGQQFVLLLLTVGLLVGVVATVLQTYQGSTTSGGCSQQGLDNCSAYRAVNDSLKATTNFTAQFSTIGTIGGISLLLIVIGFGLMSLFKGRGGGGGGGGGAF
jgi:hypothetical protein